MATPPPPPRAPPNHVSSCLQPGVRGGAGDVRGNSGAGSVTSGQEHAGTSVAVTYVNKRTLTGTCFMT